MEINNDSKRIMVEITTGTIVRSVLFILLLLGLYYIKDIVTIVLFAVVLASAIEPMATWLQKRRIPRVPAVLFIYLLAFAVLGTIFYLVIPTFVSELSNFAASLPGYLEDPENLRGFVDFLPFSANVTEILQEVLNSVKDKLSALTQDFLQVIANIFGGVLSFVLLVVLSFYLSVQKNGLENFLKIITPKKYENYILDLWQRSGKKIGGWLQGQILLGILVGILVFIGLTILKMEYALTFALLAAVFEIIPVFGPILAAVPPVAIAFLQSPTYGLVVVGLFVIIQQFENHLIYPLVVRKIIGLPPVIVILALVIGGKLAGLLGVLLSVPVAAAFMEFVNDVAVRKKIEYK